MQLFGREWLARLDEFDGLKLRFQVLFFTQFVAFAGFAVFRNVYLKEMGLSGSAMGTIGFLMTFTGVLAQPVWGLVTDYLRAERPVLLIGALVSAVGLLAYPAGETLASPFLLLAAGTALYSAFRAPIVPVANGMILSRGYNYGNIRAWGSIAFGIGSLGFGFLVAALGISSVVYFYLLGMGVLAAIVWGIPERESIDDDGDGFDVGAAARRLVTNPNFLTILAVTFVLGMAQRGGAAFFSVFMRGVDAHLVLGPWTITADALTGATWTIKTVFEAVAFVYAARLGISYKYLLVIGGAAVTFPNLVYSQTGAPVLIALAQIPGGIGYGFFYLGAVNLVHNVADEAVTSTAQTVLTGAGIGLGGAIGQVVAGRLYDAVGLQQMYLYVAAIGFVGAAFGLLVRRGGRAGEGEMAT